MSSTYAFKNQILINEETQGRRLLHERRRFNKLLGGGGKKRRTSKKRRTLQRHDATMESEDGPGNKPGSMWLTSEPARGLCSAKECNYYRKNYIDKYRLHKYTLKREKRRRAKQRHKDRDRDKYGKNHIRTM